MTTSLLVIQYMLIILFMVSGPAESTDAILYGVQGNQLVNISLSTGVPSFRTIAKLPTNFTGQEYSGFSLSTHVYYVINSVAQVFIIDVNNPQFTSVKLDNYALVSATDYGGTVYALVQNLTKPSVQHALYTANGINNNTNSAITSVCTLPEDYQFVSTQFRAAKLPLAYNQLTKTLYTVCQKNSTSEYFAVEVTINNNNTCNVLNWTTPQDVTSFWFNSNYSDKHLLMYDRSGDLNKVSIESGERTLVIQASCSESNELAIDFVNLNVYSVGCNYLKIWTLGTSFTRSFFNAELEGIFGIEVVPGTLPPIPAPSPPPAPAPSPTTSPAAILGGSLAVLLLLLTLCA